MTDAADNALPADQQALLDAVNALLLPMARLAVSRGVHFSVIEERLRHAFVQAAREANPGGLPHRQVSRISTITGINRREVTRLVQTDLATGRPRRSVAGQVYAHWLTNPVYRDLSGTPSRLPRQGPRPSFETLAREITSDVHPRSLLQEMLRLGYAQLAEDGDTVLAVPDALVARGNLPRALRILGDNVGHHLQAAVTNVLGDEPVHFEKAIVATGLPAAEVATVRKLVEAQWRLAFDALVPALERLIDSAGEPDADEPPRHRALIGLYSFHQPDTTPAPEPTGAPTDDGASTA